MTLKADTGQRPAAASAVQEWRIPSSADPSAELFVRARGTPCAPGDTPVLLVHGFFQPASAILDVPDFSLQATLAARGLRVYLVDLRGYGQSSRPPFMHQAAELTRPSLGQMDDALADLQDAVSFVLQQEAASKVDLVGYSWGTARSARFALAFPAQVRRLALYAPVWRPSTGAAGEAQDPDQPDRLRPALGGYTVFRPGDLQRNWDWEIGAEDPAMFRTQAALHAADAALLASDPDRGEPGFRAPLGPMVDALGVARGGSLFDATRLRHEVLLVRGDRDRLSSEADARALFEAIGSTSKRLITIGWGTHLMHIERSAGAMLEELVSFLSRRDTPQ